MDSALIETFARENLMAILTVLLGGLAFALRLQFGEKRLSEKQKELRASVEGLETDVNSLKTKVAVLEEKHEGTAKHVGTQLDTIQKQLSEIFRTIRSK